MTKRILPADNAMFLVRLMIGLVFLVAGWMKASDMTATVGFFSTMHIPALFAYIVTYGEVIGGVMLIIGLWTQTVASFLAIVMIVAVWLTYSGGFAMYSTPLATLAGLIAILGNGAGKYQVGRRG